ncbi:hypothetical protein ACH4FA_02080 [Streptomyces sp. NPDC017966]
MNESFGVWCPACRVREAWWKGAAAGVGDRWRAGVGELPLAPRGRAVS